jgi:hypothetical protein
MGHHDFDSDEDQYAASADFRPAADSRPQSTAESNADGAQATCNDPNDDSRHPDRHPQEGHAQSDSQSIDTGSQRKC